MNHKISQEKAILIGIINLSQDEDKIKEYLDELAFLARTAGAKPVKKITQKIKNPHPKTFIGKGKLEEVNVFIKEGKANVVIFDDELSPSQLRNIEKILDCKILDRTNLILDIFAKRAKTSYARTQVELAQYEYLLPRLTRLWTHLSKQKGGIGMKGPGETEIETDRRIIRKKISILKKKLKNIDKQMKTQRKNRGRWIRVALVGYTNVGKSTIMNLLSKSKVFAENKLFATLDTTVRKVVINKLPFLLSDTVGFIRKLPTQLIESFKSTLDEIKESDLLLHVVDISHQNFEEHIDTVKKTLHEIESLNIPSIIIFNKIDAYHFIKKDPIDLTEKRKENISLTELKNSWMSKINEQKTVFISATKLENIKNLEKKIYKEVQSIYNKRYPYNTLN